MKPKRDRAKFKCISIWLSDRERLKRLREAEGRFTYVIFNEALDLYEAARAGSQRGDDEQRNEKAG